MSKVLGFVTSKDERDHNGCLNSFDGRLYGTRAEAEEMAEIERGLAVWEVTKIISGEDLDDPKWRAVDLVRVNERSLL